MNFKPRLISPKMYENKTERCPVAFFLTNHSARKTTVQKLIFFGFLKCEIKNITGHSSERGLDTYDSGNDDEMFAMSSAISKFKYSSSTVVQKN